MKPTAVEFDDLTIRKIFGADAAEDEDPDRLKQYFFRNKAYSNIRADLPLRLLVGHKGIGKSALLRMSFMEDTEKGVLSLWLQPTDLVVEDARNSSFVERIEKYKEKLNSVIFRKSLESLNLFNPEKDALDAQATAKDVVSAIYNKVISWTGVDTNSEKRRMRDRFVGKKTIRVYIDDVDRGWSASAEDITNISALVNAARDLTNEVDSNIQIRIGLRSDAYFLYRTSDESTDKIEGNVVRLMWTRHDVLVVFALRIATFLGKQIDVNEFSRRNQSSIATELSPVFEERFSVGRGHWDRAPIHKVMLSLNRNRPRDMIKLATEAAREAYKNGHSIISATDLESVFSNYSHGRITDLCLEFKSELPEIEQLLYNMGPTTKQFRDKNKRWRYSTDELIVKLKNLMSTHRLTFRSGKPVSAKGLAEFLYKIDFVIARSTGADGKPVWTHFDQNRMLQSQFVDFGYSWEVHPAYRWALSPKNVLEILEDIDL